MGHSCILSNVWEDVAIDFMLFSFHSRKLNFKNIVNDPYRIFQARVYFKVLIGFWILSHLQMSIVLQDVHTMHFILLVK